MKNTHLIVIITFIFSNQLMSGQKLPQDDVEKLTQVLNTTLASDFNVELTGNKVYCNIDKLNYTLDLRSAQDIAQNSLSKEAIAKLNAEPYIGSVFWEYDFQTSKNSGVLFKSTKSQKLFCNILFDEQETIQIKSQLNAYTSHHKTSDSSPHLVNWSGEKYISFSLAPKRIDDKIELAVRGITISGKFSRDDESEISKNYSSLLRDVLKREFEKLFASEDMLALISKKYKKT